LSVDRIIKLPARSL